MITRARAGRQRVGWSLWVLQVRAFRLFFIGQTLSVCGMWMANVTLSLLVLRLTHSGTALGVVAGLQALPILVGSPYAGLLADRHDKRLLLLVVQSARTVLALILTVVTAADVVNLAVLAVFATATGVTNAVEVPTRQAFLTEMVGPEYVGSAIPLNNVMANGGRIVGPSLAALLISGVGFAACFGVNTLASLAIVVTLVRIHPAELHRSPPLERGQRQVTAGLRYVWSTRGLRIPLASVAVIGVVAWQYPVTLPLLAASGFDGGATLTGAMFASMAAGALLCGLRIAGRPHTRPRPLFVPTMLLGVALILPALAPDPVIACLLLTLSGWASVAFSTVANTNVQLTSMAGMRGRVMALYTLAFSGAPVIGGPLVGLVGEQLGGRTALALGGVLTVAVSLALPSRPRRYIRKTP